MVRQAKGNAVESLAATRVQREEAPTNHASTKKQLNMLADNLSRMGVKTEDLPQIEDLPRLRLALL